MKTSTLIDDIKTSVSHKRQELVEKRANQEWVKPDQTACRLLFELIDWIQWLSRQLTTEVNEQLRHDEDFIDDVAIILDVLDQLRPICYHSALPKHMIPTRFPSPRQINNNN